MNIIESFNQSALVIRTKNRETIQFPLLDNSTVKCRWQRVNPVSPEFFKIAPYFRIKASNWSVIGRVTRYGVYFGGGEEEKKSGENHVIREIWIPSFQMSFEPNSIGERIGGIDGEIFENWRARGDCRSYGSDNRIASDFCMPISRPALCRRQYANNYAKRRLFIRPFDRIQTAFPYPLSSHGANNRPDTRWFQFFCWNSCHR